MPVSLPVRDRVSDFLFRAKLHRATCARSPRTHKVGNERRRTGGKGQRMWARGAEEQERENAKDRREGALSWWNLVKLALNLRS